ncbi:TetR family transcriptional regulator [Hypericibacter adhaerens]|uniref:TetR family transcriptional regulator n=1 Tax=Hypericibacter adhaerens TaxID=2602016 RepID=A0A5J6N572_9PROT|nr:TetR/AcrR family transcriptional regulator [Hypericibacter adhaerens]QEX25242.1 TetR family transcriptional regulator [Hypericibacter adhaerens]
MKPSPRAELKARKQAYVQDEILAAAARLFAERGYRAVTIDDIGSSLDYTKSVVYYYFTSKNEILWQIFQRIYDSYFAGVSEIRSRNLPPAEAMAQIIRRHALNVMERRDWTAIYFREESELTDQQRKENAKKKRQYDAMIEEVYEAGIAAGVFCGMPAHIAVSGLLGMCNWLYVWYKEQGAFSAEQIADYCAELLANGYLKKNKKK